MSDKPDYFKYLCFGGYCVEDVKGNIASASVEFLTELCKFYQCGLGELEDVIIKKRNLSPYRWDESEDD